MIYKTSAFTFNDPDNLPFSAIQYSKMKFGCRKSSFQCGKSVAEAFIKFLQENPISKPIVVAPSAFQELPKSSFHIFETFVKLVNRWLFENSQPTLITTRMRNNHVYNQDYGNLMADDREALIGSQDWIFNVDLLDNVHFVILDDLRMTGTLERVVLRQIENSRINKDTDIHLLYFAENTSDNIIDTFENELNFAAIEDYLDFVSLVLKGVDWNMRNLKYVLELPDDERLKFITGLQHFIPNFIQDFYDLVIKSNCITASRYEHSIKSIQKLIK